MKSLFGGLVIDIQTHHDRLGHNNFNKFRPDSTGIVTLKKAKLSFLFRDALHM